MILRNAKNILIEIPIEISRSTKSRILSCNLLHELQKANFHRCEYSFDKMDILLSRYLVAACIFCTLGFCNMACS